MIDFLRNVERMVEFVKASKSLSGKALEDNLTIVYEQFSLIHIYYTDHLDGLLAGYLKVPHSLELQNEIIIDKKEELQYLRAQVKEMDAAFNKDNLPAFSSDVLNFLSSLQKYTGAASGIFLNADGNVTDVLDFMNESEFTLKEKYKFKFPSMSLNYEFRTETGKLIGDDLGYKLYLVDIAVKKDWEQVALSFSILKF